MTKPLASMSLDLDNEWSYLKTHGSPSWESLPSYLDVVVPRVLDLLRERQLTITFFVVGQDAVLERNQSALRQIVAAGHEVGNHSFHHEPWLHLYDDAQLREEFDRVENALHALAGYKPIGFRGPGYSLSPAVLSLLAERGYLYDCSTFPTFIGPLARAYYFMRSRLSRSQKAERKKLFGTVREGLRPLRPYRWNTPHGAMLEIPVTTMPVFRVPIHLSYLIYLRQSSRALALAYLKMALTLCWARRVRPSMLLHPLDFLGSDDEGDLDFFPGMRLNRRDKLQFVGEVFDRLQASYDWVPMHTFAASELKCTSPLALPPSA